MTDYIRLTAYPKLEFWPESQPYKAASYLIEASNLDIGAVKALLSDPVTEVMDASVPGFLGDLAFDSVADIHFLPGVTDNRARTAKETLVAAGIIKPAQTVSSACLYVLQAGQSAKGLHNPLIEAQRLVDRQEFLNQGPQLFQTNVLVSADLEPVLVDLDLSDEELEQLSKLGIKGPDGKPRGPLGLSLEDLKAIASHYKALDRQATDIEIEALAQSWSEHCSHRLFSASIDGHKDGIFKRYIARATHEILAKPHKQEFCLSVFKDNAGAIVFDQDWMVCDKVETHNSPSALDPYGGAMTGVVGVNRDCLGFGLGAKPIANRYGFCFGPTDHPVDLFRDAKAQDPMLSSTAIAKGVVAGIEDGGNQSGIPTVQGFTVYDRRYRGKPLVFCGTVGLAPRQLPDGRKGAEKSAVAGDRIVVVGGRVGRDGIHGATFSSVELDENSPATAVQIGDPITQKRLSDCLIRELRDQGLYSALTDNGAGGLSSSIGEMAEDTGGAIVHLDRVPLKYPGLSPWEIWISESQERMTLAVPAENVASLVATFSARGVEATDIGEFTVSGELELVHSGRTFGSLTMEFLHKGAPQKQLKTKAPKPRVWAAPTIDVQASFQRLAEDPNIKSGDHLALLFDHEVQSTSVVKPLQGPGRIQGDATVIAPVLGSDRGVALSHSLRPWLTEKNPYAAAVLAVDDAVRFLVATGADPSQVALQDNFCWCSSEDPERLWQLSEAARGCYEAAVHFEAPYISGKDSMYNDFKGFDESGQATKVSALPTLLISGIGIAPSLTSVQTMDFKTAGDLVMFVGEPDQRLGGSQLEAAFERDDWEAPKAINLTPFATLNSVYQLLSQGLLASVTAVGRGGLAHAMIRSAKAGTLGLELDDKVQLSAASLFAEAGAEFLISLDPENLPLVTKLLPQIQPLGRVTNQQRLVSAKYGLELSL